MKQDPNTETNVCTITASPETLAAIRIAVGIPQLTTLIGTALATWGAIGTTDPVDLDDIRQSLADAAKLIPQLQRDLTLLHDAMLVQDNNI